MHPVPEMPDGLCGNMVGTHDGNALGHSFTPPETHTPKEQEPSPTSASHSSHGSHRDSGRADQQAVDDDLLAGVRDGSWLDAQTFDPLTYAVPGLIPEGFSLVIGPPKVGKSWLLANLLLSVAAGGRALGKLDLGEKRPVLYLALEDGDRRMQDRCRIVLGDGEPIPPLFRYITQIQPNAVLVTIEAFLRRYPDTALVVLDTLGKVMPPALQGESAYQRDYRIGTALKRIADSHPGLAMSAVHHDRKAAAEDFVDSVSGTNGLAGSADTIAVLSRRRGESDGLLKVTGRDVPEAEYALRLEDGTQWVLDGATLGEAADTATRREDTRSLGDKSKEIVEFVAQHAGPVKAADITAKFGRSAAEYLRRLEESGRLIKPRRGWYEAPKNTVRTVRTVRTPGQEARPNLTVVGKDGQVGTCLGCNGPMTLLHEGQLHHPSSECEQAYQERHGGGA